MRQLFLFSWRNKGVVEDSCPLQCCSGISAAEILSVLGTTCCLSASTAGIFNLVGRDLKVGHELCEHSKK